MPQALHIGVGVHGHHLKLDEPKPGPLEVDAAGFQPLGIIRGDGRALLQKTDEQVIPHGLRAGGKPGVRPLGQIGVPHTSASLSQILLLFVMMAKKSSPVKIQARTVSKNDGFVWTNLMISYPGKSCYDELKRIHKEESP